MTDDPAVGRRARVVRAIWIVLITMAGVLAALPVALTASGMARWHEAGPDAAHHADAIVAGRVSPWPVDSDEQLVAVGVGLVVTAVLAVAAAAVHRLLHRRLAVRPAPAALVAAAVWCAPSVVYWLSWPAA